MSLDNAKNFSKVVVSTGYDAAATTIVLSSGNGARLPTASFNVVWWNFTDYPDPSDDPGVEICRVNTVVGDTLHLVRAQEGTTATVKNIGGKTYKMIAGLTAKVINIDIPELITPNFSYQIVNTGVTVTIPIYQQMIVHNEIEILGNLVEDGELVII
jgi:hypothetical protein